MDDAHLPQVLQAELRLGEAIYPRGVARRGPGGLSRHASAYQKTASRHIEREAGGQAQLGFHAIRITHIIAIQEAEPVAVCEGNGPVLAPANSAARGPGPLRLCDDCDTRLLERQSPFREHGPGVVRRAVVHHDDLEGPIGLGGNRVESSSQPGLAVADCHDHAHERGLGQVLDRRQCLRGAADEARACPPRREQRVAGTREAAGRFRTHVRPAQEKELLVAVRGHVCDDTS